jgi:tetratricopeptide (TPR) repeat protein
MGGVTLVGQSLSPAQQAVDAARKAIAGKPKSVEAQSELAVAVLRRARETADPGFYTQAAEPVAAALTLAPDNFEVLKLRARVLLGLREWAQARELAVTLNKRVPDDIQVYGFLTEANAELGHYADAETACQWMLDLRPNNPAAFARTAYLRELFGDIEGAIEMMTAVYQRTPSGEAEERTWALTQLGHLETQAGRLDRAESALQAALMQFPDYPEALAKLAVVRVTQKKYPEAIDLLKRRYAAVSRPVNLYALADAYERAGMRAEAAAAYADFEARARRVAANWDNANRELVFYYAGPGRKPAEALKIAEMDAARRQDVRTLDAYAWALYANGRASEARTQMDRVLAVGIKDPEILARAETIAGKKKASR